ncbi:N-acetylmuramoyl-L-alanine amidase family protein [Desulforudis sp. 1088]|uniref:N-acetylmuramoyl-L-alanine amidase family protein n=1 Tax=Desulforudis sp. 1088 TaxID=3416137 RepID=UPI003CEC6A79
MRHWRIRTFTSAVCLVTFILALLTGGHAAAAAHAGLKGRTIVIDPGHGGLDPGAVDEENGILEKEINIAVARLLAQLLRDQGARVIMTWEEESAFCRAGADGPVWRVMGLDERVAVARENRADLVVSIHANSFRDRRCFGPEIFYCRGSREGLELARCFYHKLMQLGEVTAVDVRPSSYYLLRETPMPAVIIEMGYISNRRERRLLLEPTYQQKLAEAFHQAINDYFARKKHQSP